MAHRSLEFHIQGVQYIEVHIHQSVVRMIARMQGTIELLHHHVHVENVYYQNTMATVT